MRDLPRPGLEPMSPALAGGFLIPTPPGEALEGGFFTSGPPGKSLYNILDVLFWDQSYWETILAFHILPLSFSFLSFSFYA